MRTLTLLWLLNLIVWPALAQAQASRNVMRVDPMVQRERDQTRLRILQDELVAETRDLAAALNEWRDAQASRAAFGRVQEISERIARHRQNLSALEREIGLVARPLDLANRDSGLRDAANRDRRLSPDARLVPCQGPPDAPQNAVPAALVHRQASADEPGPKLPEWIIQGGFTGTRP